MGFKLLVLIFTSVLCRSSFQHGMMLEPPNRSSLWRFDRVAIANYNDNQNFCGGVENQWGKFDGKCGVCGDKFDDPHPQANENTGIYGQGTVVRMYNASSIIDVQILITANHLGNFQYSLCKLENPKAPEPGEDCFMPLVFEDGQSQYDVHSSDVSVINRIKLPDFPCERCVLRWHYTAGNSWGTCSDGTEKLGCGSQETFRSCADISIL